MKCYAYTVIVGYHNAPLSAIVFAENKEEAKSLALKALEEYALKSSLLEIDYEDEAKEFLKGLSENPRHPAEFIEISMEPNTVVVPGTSDFGLYWE